MSAPRAEDMWQSLVGVTPWEELTGALILKSRVFSAKDLFTEVMKRCVRLKSRISRRLYEVQISGSLFIIDNNCRKTLSQLILSFNSNSHGGPSEAPANIEWNSFSKYYELDHCESPPLTFSFIYFAKMYLFIN